MSSTPCLTQLLNQGWQNDTLWGLPTIIPFFQREKGFSFPYYSVQVHTFE